MMKSSTPAFIAMMNSSFSFTTLQVVPPWAIAKFDDFKSSSTLAMMNMSFGSGMDGLEAGNYTNATKCFKGESEFEEVTAFVGNAFYVTLVMIVVSLFTFFRGVMMRSKFWTRCCTSCIPSKMLKLIKIGSSTIPLYPGVHLLCIKYTYQGVVLSAVPMIHSGIPSYRNFAIIVLIVVGIFGAVAMIYIVAVETGHKRRVIGCVDVLEIKGSELRPECMGIYKRICFRKSFGHEHAIIQFKLVFKALGIKGAELKEYATQDGMPRRPVFEKMSNTKGGGPRIYLLCQHHATEGPNSSWLVRSSRGDILMRADDKDLSEFNDFQRQYMNPSNTLEKNPVWKTADPEDAIQPAEKDVVTIIAGEFAGTKAIIDDIAESKCGLHSLNRYLVRIDSGTSGRKLKFKTTQEVVWGFQMRYAASWVDETEVQIEFLDKKWVDNTPADLTLSLSVDTDVDVDVAVGKNGTKWLRGKVVRAPAIVKSVFKKNKVAPGSRQMRIFDVALSREDWAVLQLGNAQSQQPDEIVQLNSVNSRAIADASKAQEYYDEEYRVVGVDENHICNFNLVQKRIRRLQKTTPFAERYFAVLDGQIHSTVVGIAVTQEMVAMISFGIAIGFISDPKGQVFFLLACYFVRTLVELWWWAHPENVVVEGCPEHWAFISYRSHAAVLRRLNFVLPEAFILAIVLVSVDHDLSKVCKAAGSNVEGMVMSAVMLEVALEVVLLGWEAIYTKLKYAGKNALSLLPIVMAYNYLGYATSWNHINVVQQLLQCGVAPDFAWEGEQTALMTASQLGYTRIARSLLQAGALPARHTMM